MRVLIVLAFSLGYAIAAPNIEIVGDDDADDIFAQFSEFKLKYQKVYRGLEEEILRFKNFKTHMAKAKVLQESDQGTATYGATQFADLSDEEYKHYVMSPEIFTQKNNLPYANIPDVSDTPDSYDWRGHGAVTKVKNQRHCGSCWAFATTGNIEGQWYIKKAQLISLSEQELVSCDKVDWGCRGGRPSQAYEQVMKLGGLESEKDYPYKGESMRCSLTKDPVVYINGSVSISKNEGEMAAWLAKNSPIAAALNSNAMRYYTGGISHPEYWKCGPWGIDHAVLIVGYGIDGEIPYWLVKNSWGLYWGENGYYRIYRGDEVCGINRDCTSAVIH